MASLCHVSELLSAEFVLNLGIVGSVSVFTVSKRWNLLVERAWDAVKVLRLTDNASTNVSCDDDKGMCVADCTLLHWSRLPEKQKERLPAHVQSLILYVGTPWDIFGLTSWRDEYAARFSSLESWALVHVRSAGGPLEIIGEIFLGIIPVSVRQVYLQCELCIRLAFPAFPENHNIHCLAVRQPNDFQIFFREPRHCTQVTALANLCSLASEADVRRLLHVVQWCSHLQRLGLAVCEPAWSRLRDANNAGCLGHVTVLLLGFESILELLVEHIVEAIPRSVQLLFLRFDGSALTPCGNAGRFITELGVALRKHPHHAGMWVFVQDNNTLAVPYTQPWSWWEGPHVDMFSQLMERSLWKSPIEFIDAMGLHRWTHVDIQSSAF